MKEIASVLLKITSQLSTELLTTDYISNSRHILPLQPLIARDMSNF